MLTFVDEKSDRIDLAVLGGILQGRQTVEVRSVDISTVLKQRVPSAIQSINGLKLLCLWICIMSIRISIKVVLILDIVL